MPFFGMGIYLFGRHGIMVNFFGMLISDVQFLLVDDNVLWLQAGDFEWL